MASNRKEKAGGFGPYYQRFQEELEFLLDLIDGIPRHFLQCNPNHGQKQWIRLPTTVKFAGIAQEAFGIAMRPHFTGIHT
jgi:hypothetical protein